MIVILIFDLLHNFSLDRLAVVCALVAVNATTARWPIFNKFLAFGLVLQSEASNAISQNVLIMLEFVYHASTSVSLEKHLLVLLIKEMCFKSVSRNLVEYTTMSIVLILLKKDFKGLWAMKEYYSDLVTDLQKASNRFNCGYFIINDSGDILEMNPIAVNISIALCEDSAPLHITDIFSKEHTQRIFSMINIAKKGLIAEEEFLFIFKPPKQYDEFSSILTRIMPITIHGMKSFLLIIKDISRFVTLRSVAVTTMRNVQSYTNTLANKISNCYTKQNAITENEVYMSLDHFYRQLDIEGLLSFMLGNSEVSMCDFDIRIEVVNMIQICWKNWTDNNFKVNLVVDKDLPCVRNDRLKHNQLLKMLLEYTLLHTDKNSDLLLTLSQTSLHSVQYRFKFYSNSISQEEMDAVFSKYLLTPLDYEKLKIPPGLNLNLCGNLIKILKGDFEEVKYHSDLNKVTISYVLNFEKGNIARCNSICFIEFPRDSSVISWPPVTLPKRTNLSISKVRKLVHSSNSNGSSLGSGILSTVSHEGLDLEARK